MLCITHTQTQGSNTWLRFSQLCLSRFGFFGVFFTVIGIVGKVTVRGVPYYGKYRWPVKLIVTAVGLGCFAIAYAMV